MVGSETRRYALLVGVQNYPHARPEHQLQGCINDARALETLLTTRFAFAPQNVLVLENPARQAILEAFETHLIQKCQAGDLAVFAFSGHGSYTWDLEGDEPDGYDETLVPADAHYNPTQAPPHIRDDELFELNARLQEKIGQAGFVVYLIDSCHSGTITRGVGRARFMDPELPEPPRPEMRPKALLTPALQRLASQAYKTWFPDQCRYVLLAACRDDERAIETVDIDGHAHGVFTLFLTKALWKAPPAATYQDVFEEATASVRRTNPHQNPYLEGDPTTAVFGLERFDVDPYLPVKQITETNVTLGGGSAYRVSPGSHFAIYDPHIRSLYQARVEGKAPLAEVEISELQALRAKARFLRPPTRPVKAGYRAFEILHQRGELRMPVAVLGAPPLVASVRQVLENSPLVQLVDLTGGAQLVIWALTPETPPLNQPALTVPSGLPDRFSCVITDVGGEALMRPIPAGQASHLETLRNNVETIARHLNFLALTNDHPQASLRGKIQLALKRLERQGDLWVAVDPPGIHEAVFSEGDRIALEISNHHDQPVYFGVFDLGLSWRIAQLWPPGLESEKLAPGGKFILGLRPPGIAYVGEATIPDVFPQERSFGRETFKLLLTTQPIPLRWFVQPGVKAPVLRGDALTDLLALIRSGAPPGGGRYRGEDFRTPGSENWATRQVTFVLQRKERHA